MKRLSIMIAGLLVVGLLTVSMQNTKNLALAQDSRDSEDDVILMNVKPSSGDIPVDGEDIITKVVPLGGEGRTDPEQGTVSVTVSFDKTAGLPLDVPVAMGVLLEQSEGSITIDSYSTQMVAGMRMCERTPGGKETKILVTERTRFVEDVTDFSQAEPGKGSHDLHVKQTLKTVPRPDLIPECAAMLIWGELQGDHVIADVILFHDELH